MKSIDLVRKRLHKTLIVSKHSSTNAILQHNHSAGHHRMESAVIIEASPCGKKKAEMVGEYKLYK